MRVSLVMLTYDRADIVERTMAHNLANAGARINELIWVDNGSTDGVRDVMFAYHPDVCVLNKTNLGVSKGYNRGFAVATGSHIVITDSDMLMPDGWLATLLAYLIAIPHTGVACMFHHEVKDKPRPVDSFNGIQYHPCIPWGRRIVSRELLKTKIGYLREDFGLYGFEDVEWARRAVRVCNREGLLTYSIPGHYAEHIGCEDQDPTDYRTFKQQEGSDPKKLETFERCRADNYPYFNPYA